MYNRAYTVPSSTNSSTIYNNQNNNGGYYDERGFWVPFVVGGLAGGALGYGIANNNFLSNGNAGGFYPGPRPCCMPTYYPMPNQNFYF